MAEFGAARDLTQPVSPYERWSRALLCCYYMKEKAAKQEKQAIYIEHRDDRCADRCDRPREVPVKVMLGGTVKQSILLSVLSRAARAHGPPSSSGLGRLAA